MVRTVLFLIITLLLVPVSVIYFDKPLLDTQWHILKVLCTIYLTIALACFVTGELTKNVSQVDKLWSIMPMVYTWYMAYAGAWDVRLVTMAILVTIWGVRLSYNFSRRGGYSLIPWEGEEDYRWSVLRRQPAFKNRLAWSAFHLFFICIYQQGLILLFTMPMLLCFEALHSPLGFLDILAAMLMFTFIIIETIADQQQYGFQTEKYKRIFEKKDLGEYSHGFVNTGLWAKMRHPNYASEQMIWICFYVFSIAATGRILNWSICGCILLCLLFVGSSDFSEKISAEKYPEYKDYQNKVPRFIPKI